MGVANNDHQSLSPAYGYVKAFRVAEETQVVPYVWPYLGLSWPHLEKPTE